MTEPEREPDLLEETDRLIAALEAHADPEVRDRVRALLERIDTIHRTALTRLVGAIQAMAGEAFINRLTADPAIRLLLMSYDLLTVDRRLLADEALDGVRGHLHGHGIDVELIDVIGGAVTVKLHGADRAAVDPAAVQRDLETALSGGLPGFQELTIGEHARHPGAPLLQIDARRVRQPVYRTVCVTSAVPPGVTHAVDVDGASVLIANVAGEIYAIADHCGDTPLPLRFGSLDGAELRCSWHGCRYDVRSGTRLDRAAEPAPVYPVKVENGEIRIAVSTASSAA